MTDLKTFRLPCPHCGEATEYLASREVAEYLGYGMTYVARLAERLGGIRIPRLGYLFPVSAVEKFKRERNGAQATPKPEPAGPTAKYDVDPPEDLTP